MRVISQKCAYKSKWLLKFTVTWERGGEGNCGPVLKSPEKFGALPGNQQMEAARIERNIKLKRDATGGKFVFRNTNVTAAKKR